MSFTLLLQILKALLYKSFTQLVFTETSANFGVECKEKQASILGLFFYQSLHWLPCTSNLPTQPLSLSLTSSHEIWGVTFIGQSPSSAWGKLQHSALSWVHGLIWHCRTTCVQTAGKPSSSDTPPCPCSHVTERYSLMGSMPSTFSCQQGWRNWKQMYKLPCVWEKVVLYCFCLWSVWQCPCCKCDLSNADVRWVRENCTHVAWLPYKKC